MSVRTLPAHRVWGQLDSLPVSLFGAVMALTGLALAWQLAHKRYGAPEWIADFIGAVAIAAFLALALGYAIKLAGAPDAVLAEFRHPIAGNLFGTIFISLLLLPILLAPLNLLLAQAIWAASTIGMLAFAWLIISRWMSSRQQVEHATPVWIIPVVGVLNVPLAVPSLGLPPMHGVMVAGLAIGLFFTVPLFTLIFSRLLFQPPMPDDLLPSLMILTAPFAVGFSAYVATAGNVDLFAESLYMLNLFLLALLLERLRNLWRCCPFRISWWAVSFPLAASAVAALRFAVAEPGWITDAIALSILAFTTLTLAGLMARTLIGLARGELRRLN